MGSLERIESSTDKAEKEGLQKAMKLRLQAIKKIKAEEEAPQEETHHSEKFTKTSADLEKLSKDTAASDLSEEKKERIQNNIEHMKTNLERIESSTDKAEKERLQQAMKVRLTMIKKIKAEEE